MECIINMENQIFEIFERVALTLLNRWFYLRYLHVVYSAIRFSIDN